MILARAFMLGKLNLELREIQASLRSRMRANLFQSKVIRSIIKKEKEMLSKEKLAHYEVAARLYCERIGEDPEVRVPRAHPEIRGVVDTSTRMWHLAAEKIHDLSMMLTALRDAALAKDNAGKILVPGANDA